MIPQEILNTPIDKSFLALPPTVSIKQAIAKMAEVKTSCALIVENQVLLGILTERDVVRITTTSNWDETSCVCEFMTQNVITLSLAEIGDVFALSYLLTHNRIRHLPVVNDQQHLVGLITPSSIRSLFKPEYLLRYVRVMEVMRPLVIQGLPSDSIFVIAQKMTDQRVSCVVIVDPRTKFPVGIITERDIVRFHQLNLDFDQVLAEQIMSTPLSTMQPQDSLWNVHQRMQELNVRRLVITDPMGKLAGIVTQTQMLKVLDPTEIYYVMAQMQEIIDQQTCELQQLNYQLKVANSELEYLSKVDELTQILNRRQFNEVLTHEWDRLARLSLPLSLILCDVDQFKNYNDTYGHLAGDECLKKIAKTLRRSTRQGLDSVARYGGEEFVIVLPNTSIHGAESVSKAILTQIQKLEIPHQSTDLGIITVSLGTATIIPDPTISCQILIQMADKLLYQAKQEGRNTYCIQALDSSLQASQPLSVREL